MHKKFWITIFFIYFFLIVILFINVASAQTIPTLPALKRSIFEGVYFDIPRVTGDLIGSSTVTVISKTSSTTKLCLTGDICRTTWPTGGGGGGNGLWATNTSSTLMYPATPTNVVVIGSTASNSLGILNVIGQSYFSDNLRIGTTSAHAKLAVYTTSTTGILVDSPSGFTGKLLDLKNASSSKFVVQGDGRVTLGTSTSYSGEQFQIWSGASTAGIKLRTEAAGQSSYIAFDKGASTKAMVCYDNDSNTLQLSTGGACNASQFVIDSSGRVGIGTLLPTANLQVTAVTGNSTVNISSADGAGNQIIYFNDNVTNEWHIGRTDSANRLDIVESGVAEVMSFLPGGKIGIGTISPSSKLDVVGDARFSNRISIATSTPSLAKISLFSTSTTGILMDSKSGFIGNLLDLKLASTTRFSVTESKVNTANAIYASSTLSVTGNIVSVATGTMNGLVINQNATMTKGIVARTIDIKGSGKTSNRGILNIKQSGQTVADGIILEKNNTANYYGIYLNGVNALAFSNGVDQGWIDVNGKFNAKALIATGFGYLQASTSKIQVGNFYSKIGIATSTPSAKLSVFATSTTLILGDTKSGFTGNLLDLKVASSSKFFIKETGQMAVNTTTPKAFISITAPADSVTPVLIIASSTQRTMFIIRPNNKVGIGTSTPNFTLDVWGQINASSTRIKYVTSTAAGSINNLFYTYGGRGGGITIPGATPQRVPAFTASTVSTGLFFDFLNNSINFERNGVALQRFGIVSGITYSSGGFRVGAESGNNQIDDATQGTASTVLYIGVNTINTTAPSDVRLKTEIQPTNFNPQSLMDLNIVDFRFKTDPEGTKRTGLIAQELLNTKFKDFVQQDSEGIYIVRYQDFIPYLLKAYQEQQKEIESIKAETKPASTGQNKGQYLGFLGLLGLIPLFRRKNET